MKIALTTYAIPTLLLLLWGTTMLGFVSAEETCTTSNDCESEDSYCASSGTCLSVGACAEVSDCSDPTNQPFALVMCVGTMECREGMCGMKCGDMGDDRMACDAYSTDPSVCGERAYCSSEGICTKIGSCAIADDCFHQNNVGFGVALCFGNMECTSEKKCEMDCNGGSDAIMVCDTSEDCLGDDDYCSTEGICMENGSCNVVDDCSNLNNTYAMIECVGTLTCESNMCGKVCGDFDSASAGNASAVEAPAAFCTRDEDCLSLAPRERTGLFAPDETPEVEYYCADGTCRQMGSCATDSDCSNPANRLYQDKKCLGYLSCDVGTCDRICGQECLRGRPGRCEANPCAADPATACPGAVSCITDTCNGSCEAVYYGEAGNILAGCGSGETSVDQSAAAPESGETSVDRSATAPDANDRVPTESVASSLESGAAVLAGSLGPALAVAAFVLLAC